MSTLCGVAITILCSIIRLYAEQEGDPPLERMRYDLKWRGMKVGEATMEARAAKEGLVRSFRVDSAGIAGWFRTIHYHITSTTSENRISVRKRIRDGKFSQTDVLVIEGTNARWREQGRKEPVDYQVPDGVVDYVSLLQNMRGASPLSPGETRSITLAMDGGLHQVDIKASHHETLKWNGSQIPTTVHKLETDSEVLFSRNSPRAFWVVKDRNLILKMTIQTRRGKVHGHLKEWTRSGKDVPLVIENNL